MKKAVFSLFLILIIISSLSVPAAAKNNTENFHTDDIFSDKVNYAFILETPNSTVIDYSKKEEAPRTGLSTLPLAIMTAISGIYIAKKKK